MHLGDPHIGHGPPLPEDQYIPCLTRLWDIYIQLNKTPTDSLAITGHFMEKTGLVLPSEAILEAALKSLTQNSFLMIALKRGWRKAFQHCHEKKIYVLCPSSKSICRVGADKYLTFYWLLAHALRLVHGFYKPTALLKAPRTRGPTLEKHYCITHHDVLHEELVAREIMACRMTQASQKERLLDILKEKGAFFVKMYVLPNALEMQGEYLHIHTQNRLHYHILLESFTLKDFIKIHLMR